MSNIFIKDISSVTDSGVYYVANGMVESSGVAMWIADASLLKLEINRLQKSGITNLKQYFKNNPDFLKQIFNLIRIESVNPETLELYNVSSKFQFEKLIKDFFLSSEANWFINAIHALTSGANDYKGKTTKFSSLGKKLNLFSKLKLSDNSQNDWSFWYITEHCIEELEDDKEEFKKELASLREEIERKDKLISILGHEIKSPLANVINFSNLILDSKDHLEEKKLIQYTSYINQSALKCNSLISSVLDWNKCFLGKSEIENCRINEIIEEVFDFYKLQSSEKGLQLINKSPKVIELKTDKKLLFLILRNLISNAIKFSYLNSEISVSYYRLNEFVHFIVEDNGDGITHEKILKIFELNDNKSTYGTANEKGSGLGLYICKELIKKSGGKIWAESYLGKGSKFNFTIPYSE